MSMMSERLYQSWLLSYQDGTVPMTNPLARPWEATCRECQREEFDDKVARNPPHPHLHPHTPSHPLLIYQYLYLLNTIHNSKNKYKKKYILFSSSQIILCDHCDAQYHIFCLRPALKKVPEGIWICQRCTDWLERTETKFLRFALVFVF